MRLNPTILRLKIGKRSLPIVIAAGVTSSLIPFLKKREERLKRQTKVLILSDARLDKECKQLLGTLQSKKFDAHAILLPAGEGLKDIDQVYPIYGELLALKADRDTVLIALGGGSVGDTVGFVAATYLRGIDWISIPTTLLAQVDSGVGGKTGINHKSGKNLIGAFHQPTLVICASQYLKTLSQREMVSGIGEIVKYAFIYDPKFFIWLETRFDLLLKLDDKVLRIAIKKSLEWKCKAVSQDEHDRTGKREVLNFGHTFAHALETATDYKIFQHGEAVIWGMRFAIALSFVRENLKNELYQKLDFLLSRLPVPMLPANVEARSYFELMKKDKKAEGNTVRFVLLQRLGSTISDRHVSPRDLDHAFHLLVSQVRSSR